MAVGQVSDHVHSHNLPAVLWYLIWNGPPSRCGSQDLGAIATVTALDILGNIMQDSRPPEVPSDQLERLPSAWVTSHLCHGAGAQCHGIADCLWVHKLCCLRGLLCLVLPTLCHEEHLWLHQVTALPCSLQFLTQSINTWPIPSSTTPPLVA
jgi:hypothetical protein